MGRVTRPKPPRSLVSVGFLHPGHYTHCFAESLRDLLLFDLTGKARTAHDHGTLGKECGAGDISEGRNQLAKVMCDESRAEWLFMVDSDMGFEPDTLERLLASADPKERPIVGALCFALKTDGRRDLFGISYRSVPTLYQWYDDGEQVGFVPMLDYDEGLVPVSGTGAACLVIHRSVLERIRAKYGDVWFDPIRHPSGRRIGEDLSFCVRAAAIDVPVHVDTTVKTTHDKGSLFLDEAQYRAQPRPS